MLPPWPFAAETETSTSVANGQDQPDSAALYDEILKTQKMCGEIGKMLQTVYKGLEKLSVQLDHVENPSAMIPFGLKPAPEA